MEESERERKLFGLCEPELVTQVTMNGVDWLNVRDGTLGGRGRNVFVAAVIDAAVVEGSEVLAIPLGRLAGVRMASEAVDV